MLTFFMGILGWYLIGLTGMQLINLVNKEGIFSKTDWTMGDLMEELAMGIFGPCTFYMLLTDVNYKRIVLRKGKNDDK